jgi:DNA-binding beta-propeller fold protein YncE
MKVCIVAVLSAFALSIVCVSAQAQLAVSANDGKQPLLSEVPKSHTADNIAVIDLNHFPPKVIGKADVPTSMIGPPVAVAVAHHGGFALVSNAKKFDPSDATKFVLDDTVSVIDLKDARHPKVIQTVQGGDGATGIAFNKNDTLALVAATGGTVSVFSVAGKKLTLVDRVQLDPKAQPVDVAISPDGTTAFVTQRSAPTVVRLTIEGTKVTTAGIEIPTGRQTYGVVFSPDGKFAYNTNLGGRLTNEEPAARGSAGGPRRAPPIGTVTVIDVASNKVVNTFDVGQTPEHLTLSQDGRYLAVTIGNGSSLPTGSPYYKPNGLLKVYRVDGPNLTEAAETKTGGWGQGAAWNKDHTLLLLQSGVDKDIEIYRFDGKSLMVQPTTLKFDARPGSIATAVSR